MTTLTSEQKQQVLSDAMRRAMTIIRDLEGGSLHLSAGDAHFVLYEALESVGEPVYEPEKVAV